MVHQTRTITAVVLVLSLYSQSTLAASLRNRNYVEEASEALFWERELQADYSMEEPTLGGFGSSNRDSCGCFGRTFCNYDYGDTGFCEACFEVVTKEECYTTGLPEKGAVNCELRCFGLPEINELMNIAYPMWEVDAEGRRVETKNCSVDDCEWNPFYVTKRYDGLHPDLGGHPTDNDVKYAFFGSSPYAGQPYSGTPHHCNINDPDDVKTKDCPKIKTTSDNGPDGPGHVPPHIGLASLTWAMGDNLFSLEEMFNYDFYDCRVIPDVLLKMIRNYYPRIEGEVVDYPPPIVPEGGDFQYEFPAGNGLDNQKPPYAPGPPHWCTPEMLASGNWDGVCPYVFEGPDAGKYRHPHIAYAALEVYLANLAMPEKCHKTWLQNNPDFLDPERITYDTPFPVMANDDSPSDSVENWLGQPVLPWSYESGPAKAACGSYSNAILYAARPEEIELVGSDYCTYSFDYDCWEEGKPLCCLDDNLDCPTQQPVCDKQPSIPVLGADYCTYSFDYDCWEEGKPLCCLNDNLDCPPSSPFVISNHLFRFWELTTVPTALIMIAG
jgi:hypothetical protein